MKKDKLPVLTLTRKMVILGYNETAYDDQSIYLMEGVLCRKIN
jgi:hypothetical protein